MVRRAQPDEFHFIPVKQSKVADPGSILFFFMTQPDNPALFWYQAPHRFTWGCAGCYMFTIPAPSKNSQHLGIENVIVRIIEFPSAEVFSFGVHGLSFPARYFWWENGLGLDGTGNLKADRAAICFWLKAEVNLLRASGSRVLLWKTLRNVTNYEPFMSD
jgi:hypothetical protein